LPDEWTCGHVAGAMCAECYRLLAQRANALAEENERLRDELALEQRLSKVLDRPSETVSKLHRRPPP